MSKRVNNHKGWPSKNRANNRHLKNLRSKQDQLRTMKGKKSLDEGVMADVSSMLKKVSAGIKRLTPKRFNRTR